MLRPPLPAEKRETHMRKLALAALGTLAFALSGSAAAQEKKAAAKAVIKVIKETAKVRVFETTYAPGAENAAVPTESIRVVRALQGGNLLRTYADGKTEDVSY